MNYILDIDNQTYSTRQNASHVNKFYKRLINNRVIQAKEGVNATPMLAAETAAMTASFKKNTVLQKGAATQR